MPRKGQVVYNDGLTKQQRYVQRNKERVYLANAKRRKAKRLKSAQAKANAADVAKANDPPNRPADNDAHLLAFIDETANQYHAWLSGIDSKIRIFDGCWDMASGWTEEERFESSVMETFFQDRLNHSEGLLDRLREILERVPIRCPEWHNTLDRLHEVSSKWGRMDRIMTYYFP